MQLNISGERYGRLVAIERVSYPDRHTRWLFLCDCGNSVTTFLDAVRSGRTRSCGCLLAEVRGRQSITHGQARNRKLTPELHAYKHAKARCYNPNDKKYPRYGGRGITMCEAWFKNPSQFLADMGPRPAGCTLDRVDVNGNYEPGNCRWATPSQQARNKTNNIFVDYQGVKVILKDYAKLLNIPYKPLHRRFRMKGQSLDGATVELRAKGLSFR